MTSEIVLLDLEEPRKGRIASQIIDLLYFYKIGVGRPRDVAAKMRSVIETYCTFADSGAFDSVDSLSSVVENFRNAGEQHPACQLLDELDDLPSYSSDQCCAGDPAGDDTDPFDIDELTGFVRRTLKIANAIPNLS